MSEAVGLKAQLLAKGEGHMLSRKVSDHILGYIQKHIYSFNLTLHYNICIEILK